MRDVLARQRDAAGARRQPAGQQIHERRLARAVGTDQRMARAGLEREVDRVGDDQRAEALVETPDLKNWDLENRGGADRAHRRTRRRASAISLSTMPSTPPRANITTQTSMSPTQKYQ